jgi:hypothetical protein
MGQWEVGMAETPPDEALEQALEAHALITSLLGSPVESVKYTLSQIPVPVLLRHAVLASNILALAHKLEERGELSVAPVSKQLNDMVAVLVEAAQAYVATIAPTGVDAIADARAKRLAKVAEAAG